MQDFKQQSTQFTSGGDAYLLQFLHKILLFFLLDYGVQVL
jgi:hypothetical protein